MPRTMRRGRNGTWTLVALAVASLVLQLHMAGWRTSEIAAELRYSPHRVSMIVNSALFQERKAALLRELSGKSRGPYLDGIERDAVANFEFLRALRDDETQPWRMRLRAAGALLDLFARLVPRDARDPRPSETRATRIIWTFGDPPA
jgi:hypothetical protein